MAATVTESHDGVAAMQQMAADLVKASAAGAGFDESEIVVESSQNPEGGFRWFFR